MKRGKKPKTQGFSLIEVLIVVAILSVLVAIAVPQYSAFIIKSKRADAVLNLSAISRAQWAYFSNFDHYLTREYMNAQTPGASVEQVLSGLGLDFQLDANHASRFGYILDVMDCTISQCGILGVGYFASAIGDPDRDSIADTVFVKAGLKGAWLGFYPGPDHIPVLYFDDISDRPLIP